MAKGSGFLHEATEATVERDEPEQDGGSFLLSSPPAGLGRNRRNSVTNSVKPSDFDHSSVTRGVTSRNIQGNSKFYVQSSKSGTNSSEPGV